VPGSITKKWSDLCAGRHNYSPGPVSCIKVRNAHENSVETDPNGGGWSDDRIKLAVMTALHWDLAVPRDRVQVRVDRGWVTLVGRVRRDYEKSRAEADVQTIRGVAGVTNEIDCDSENKP
jgi:osmotically-inducible protein OsmY